MLPSSDSRMTQMMRRSPVSLMLACQTSAYFQPHLDECRCPLSAIRRVDAKHVRPASRDRCVSRNRELRPIAQDGK